MASEKDVEVVRRLFEAFSRRDVDDAIAVCDPGVELWLPVTTSLASGEGPYRGHDGIHRYYEDVEQIWGELLIFPREFLRTDEYVVVLGNVSGRRGIAVYSDTGWLWRVRRGKIVYGRVYQRAQEALAAAGLAA